MFQNFIHSLIQYLQGLEGSGCAQCREAAAIPASCSPSLPPITMYRLRGLLGSPSKSSGRGHGATFWAQAPEAVPGPFPLENGIPLW